MSKPSRSPSNQQKSLNWICWNTAQIFKTGHRIGLEISSSAFPKYDRNLNTGAPLGVTTEMAVAEQRIYHDAEHPSAVGVPAVPPRQIFGCQVTRRLIAGHH